MWVEFCKVLHGVLVQVKIGTKFPTEIAHILRTMADTVRFKSMYPPHNLPISRFVIIPAGWHLFH